MRTLRLGTAIASALVEGHRVRSCARSMVTTHRRSGRRASISGCLALPARLLAWLLNALHESQVRRAFRELHRYRHLIQDDQSLRCICRDDAPG